MSFSIQVIPILIVFKDGKPIARIIGGPSQVRLDAAIEQFLCI